MHTHVAAFLHDLLDFGDMALEDQIGNQGGVQQDFHHGSAAFAILLGDQTLRNHGLEVERQIHQQLRAPLLREEIDDAVQRLIGAVGVQGGQAQMPGFGKRHCMLHGLVVADFTHQNDVRRLAQGVLQGRIPVVGVEPDLALRHHAVFVRVYELNRVLNRDDVAIGLLIAPVHHSGQGG